MRVARRVVSRMIMALGFLLAGACVIGGLWLIMPEVVDFADHTHYPIKLVGVVLCGALLAACALVWPFAWVAEHIDPDAGDEAEK